jgi:hypothetical protein
LRPNRSLPCPLAIWLLARTPCANPPKYRVFFNRPG